MQFFMNRPTLYPVSATVGEYVIAALDIRTTLVKAAICNLKPNGIEILSQADVVLTKGSNLSDLQTDFVSFQNSCQQALKLAQQASGLKFDSVVIGFSGDFIKAISQTSQLERVDASIPLEEKELDRLLLNNQAAALKQAKNQLKEEKHQDIELNLLNSALVSLIVDGQPVDNPLSMRASRLDLVLYNIFIPQKWQAAAQKCADSLNLKLIALTYRPFALAQGLLGDRQHNTQVSALMIHLDDQATDIGVIKEGVLTHSQHFGLGYHIFDQALSRNLDLDHVSLGSLKTPLGDYDFARLNEKQQIQAQKSLRHTAAVWQQALVMSLVDLELGNLPAHIYLSGPGAALSVVQRSLLQPTWQNMLPFEGEFELEILDLQKMHKIQSQLQDANELHLTTLAGLARMASNVLEAFSDLPSKDAGSFFNFRRSKNRQN